MKSCGMARKNFVRRKKKRRKNLGWRSKNPGSMGCWNAKNWSG
jgi:hypothetical protein